jgi:ABC-2 type transport system permease protein
MRVIGHIIRKEFIQVRRDRPMMAMLFIIPIVQLIILGYVFSSDVKHIPTVICDLDATQESRDLAGRIEHSGYFDILYRDNRENQLAGYLDRGLASTVFVIPKGFAERLATAAPVSVQVLLDGQDSNTSTIALGYAGGILEHLLSDRMERMLQAAGMDLRLINANVRIWYNPNLKQSDYMVPGIVVFLLTMITTLVSAMGLVREREIGTLDQLLVAPVKKHELLLGKTIPFAVIGLVEFALALLFARLWYRIPMVGNLALFALFALIYLLTTLGIGLLVSARAKTQQQAMFLAFFLMIFLMIMSGFIFPLENMPDVMQWLSYLDPMRYIMIVSREILLKGADLRHLVGQGAALVLFGGAIFSLAAARFQKRMR